MAMRFDLIDKAIVAPNCPSSLKVAGVDEDFGITIVYDETGEEACCLNKTVFLEDAYIEGLSDTEAELFWKEVFATCLAQVELGELSDITWNLQKRTITPGAPTNLGFMPPCPFK